MRIRFENIWYTKIQRLAASWSVLGSSAGGGGGEIFSTRPDSLSGPPNLLYKGYRVSFLGVKWPELEVDESPQLAPRLKKE